jgi:glycosidase
MLTLTALPDRNPAPREPGVKLVVSGARMRGMPTTTAWGDAPTSRTPGWVYTDESVSEDWFGARSLMASVNDPSFIDPDTLLDGQFDFTLKARLCEALFRPEGSLQNFAGWMASNDTFYGDGAIMTTWIGNHDIPRPIHFASREIGNCREGSSPSNGWTSSFDQPSDPAAYERLGLSFVVMMTNPGIPLIYYGDEIGLAGGGDPDNRRMMPWDDNLLSPAQRALREQVRALGQIRADNPVLARGRRITRSSSQDTWVYSMIGCGEGSPDVTVAINRADAERSVTIPAGSYTDLIGGSAVQGGPVSLGPRGYLVLRRDG